MSSCPLLEHRPGTVLCHPDPSHTWVSSPITGLGIPRAQDRIDTLANERILGWLFFLPLLSWLAHSSSNIKRQCAGHLSSLLPLLQLAAKQKMLNRIKALAHPFLPLRSLPRRMVSPSHLRAPALSVSPSEPWSRQGYCLLLLGQIPSLSFSQWQGLFFGHLRIPSLSPRGGSINIGGINENKNKKTKPQSNSEWIISFASSALGSGVKLDGAGLL